MSNSACVLLLGALAAFGCGPSEPPSWRPGSPGPEDVLGTTSASRGVDRVAGEFFPARLISEFSGEWYSKHLAAADETSLRSSAAPEAYRLTFLPSFHRPLIVRIERGGPESIIVAKELDGAGGYDPGAIVVDRHRRLTRFELDRLDLEIESMRFWQTPVHACEGRSHHDDGAVWILEGKRGREYWLAQWHWPECAVCQRLLELSELELPTGYGLPVETEPLYPPPPPLPPIRPWG